MAEKPEELARVEIDKLLAAAGWSVQSVKEANIHSTRGVALCNFPLKDGHGFADYMLYLDGEAVAHQRRISLGKSATKRIERAGGEVG